MPRYLQPRKQSEHRIAAIALYRALLSRCSSSPLPAADRTSLRNVVRNKFRRNRKIQSLFQLNLVFRAGYETLSHLDASTTGNATSINALRSLIPTLPSGIKRSPRPSVLPQPTLPPARTPFDCVPSDRAVLNVRPHAKVSGPRHVPILANANGVPFLRLGKPQPPALSRIIRQKLEARNKRYDYKILLSNYWSPIAHQEDTWDDLVERHCDLESQGSIKWIDAVEHASAEDSKAHETALAKDRAIVRKMIKIVDAETKLATKEGQNVQRGRKSRPIQPRWPM